MNNISNDLSCACQNNILCNELNSESSLLSRHFQTDVSTKESVILTNNTIREYL